MLKLQISILSLSGFEILRNGALAEKRRSELLTRGQRAVTLRITTLDPKLQSVY